MHVGTAKIRPSAVRGHLYEIGPIIKNHFSIIQDLMYIGSNECQLNFQVTHQFLQKNPAQKVID